MREMIEGVTTATNEKLSQQDLQYHRSWQFSIISKIHIKQHCQPYNCMQNNQSPHQNHQINYTNNIPNQTQKENPPQNILTETQNNKLELKKQLLAMEFEEELVEQALKTANNLEEAIQTVISLLESQDQLNKSDTVKLFLVIRMDLKMSTGKIAAQCAHATLKSFTLERKRTQSVADYPTTFIQWLETGKNMSYLRVEREDEFFAIMDKCKTYGIPYTYIRDAGRTQIAAGSATVCAIGPIKSQQLPETIRKLQTFD